MEIDITHNTCFINNNETVVINSDINLKTIIDNVEENNNNFINTDVDNTLSENFKEEIYIACDKESDDTKCSEYSIVNRCIYYVRIN